jgi:hypothetical protein
MSDLVVEKYVPSEGEKAAGKWAVVFEELFPDGEPDQDSYAHMMPTYGPAHEISFLCWCDPLRSEEPGGNGLHYYTHGAPQ